MHNHRTLQFLIRIYSRLLGLYPPAFRHKFGPEMLSVFEQAAGEAAKQGRLSLLCLLAGELAGLLLALLSLRNWNGDETMDQKAETVVQTPAPRLSRGEIFVGMLPLFVLGLGSLTSNMLFMIKVPMAVFYISYILPYLGVMAGLLWGWLNGFPRWVYPYLVYGVFFALYFTLSSQPTYKILGVDIWDVLPFVPFGLVVVVVWRVYAATSGGVSLGAVLLAAAEKILSAVWKDWTLQVYAFYGLLPLLIPFSQDEVEYSYRLPITTAAILVMLAGAVLYVAATKPWQRTTFVVGGLFLSLLTAFAGAEMYWRTHDINIITNERHLLGGPVPWGAVFSQALPLTVLFTLAVLLIPISMGVLHWLINTRRSGSSGASA